LAFVGSRHDDLNPFSDEKHCAVKFIGKTTPRARMVVNSATLEHNTVKRKERN
jgi:hypothetical protein